MTSRKFMIAGGILAWTILGAATVGFAQDYYGGRYGGGPYDYAAGPGIGLYDYGGSDGPSNYGPATPDVDRGGPGPRVQAGSGMGIGAVR